MSIAGRADYTVSQIQAMHGLWIEGMTQLPSVNHFEITECENQHEQASIFVQSASRATDFTNIIGQRVAFNYGIGRIAPFQGYVASVSPQQEISNGQFVTEQEIICLGPTMTMKGNTPRFMTDVTCTQMMQRICADNKIGFSDENRTDTYVWRSLAQTSETDWEMVCALANRIGGHVITQRGVVRLVNYNYIDVHELPSHQLVSASQLPIQGVPAVSGTIVGFTPTSLSGIDPTYRIPALAYLEGGQAVYVPSSGRTGVIARRFATDIPARSMAEAQALQQGYYYPMWAQDAEIQVGGDASIEPGQIVQIDSTNAPATRSPNYDGFWYVKSAKHYLYSNKFTSVLNIGRSGFRVGNAYPPRPFWMGDPRGVPKLILAGDGSWYSTWR